MNIQRNNWLISRRHALRGLGATLALPLLDCMKPARAAAASAACLPPTRTLVTFTGMGFHSKHWWAKGDGAAINARRQCSPCPPYVRKKEIPIISFCFSIAIAYSFLQVPVHAAPRTALVFGDSITEGNALPKEERSQAWIRQVEIQSDGQLLMINEGKGGRPTASLAEFAAMLNRHPSADILVIALGTNDSRDISAQCVPKAVKNIEAMILQAREAYSERLSILLVAPPNIRKDALGPSRPIANQREAKLQELGSAFKTLSEKLKCDFVSLYGTVPESTLTRDGVHPSGPGNQPIADTILKKLLSPQINK